MNDTGLEASVQMYGKDIYCFCLQLTKNRMEAEDLYQDTFLKAMEKGTYLDFDRNPKSYLLAIAIRLWKNKRRKRIWRGHITGTEISIEELMMEPSSSVEMVENQIISKSEKQLIRSAVNALPDTYRVPIVLFYMEQLKIAEIADVLKLPQGTVKSRLYKAKEILAKKLEVILDEERTG